MNIKLLFFLLSYNEMCRLGLVAQVECCPIFKVNGQNRGSRGVLLVCALSGVTTFEWTRHQVADYTVTRKKKVGSLLRLPK